MNWPMEFQETAHETRRKTPVVALAFLLDFSSTLWYHSFSFSFYTFEKQKSRLEPTGVTLVKRFFFFIFFIAFLFIIFFFLQPFFFGGKLFSVDAATADWRPWPIRGMADDDGDVERSSNVIRASEKRNKKTSEENTKKRKKMNEDGIRKIKRNGKHRRMEATAATENGRGGVNNSKKNNNSAAHLTAQRKHPRWEQHNNKKKHLKETSDQEKKNPTKKEPAIRFGFTATGQMEKWWWWWWRWWWWWWWWRPIIARPLSIHKSKAREGKKLKEKREEERERKKERRRAAGKGEFFLDFFFGPTTGNWCPSLKNVFPFCSIHWMFKRSFSRDWKIFWSPVFFVVQQTNGVEEIRLARKSFVILIRFHSFHCQSFGCSIGCWVFTSFLSSFVSSSFAIGP